MHKEEEPQARSTLIWSSDYRNNNVACILAGQNIRTYGDLADMRPALLRKLGLIQDEIYAVSQMLAKRGLILTKEEADHDGSS